MVVSMGPAPDVPREGRVRQSLTRSGARQDNLAWDPASKAWSKKLPFIDGLRLDAFRSSIRGQGFVFVTMNLPRPLVRE